MTTTQEATPIIYIATATTHSIGIIIRVSMWVGAIVPTCTVIGTGIGAILTTTPTGAMAGAITTTTGITRIIITIITIITITTTMDTEARDTEAVTATVVWVAM